MKIFYISKVILILLCVVIFCACATSQKQEEPAQENGFVMSQEELEEFFPTLDPAETGHCTRCGIVENGHIRK